MAGIGDLFNRNPRRVGGSPLLQFASDYPLRNQYELEAHGVVPPPLKPTRPVEIFPMSGGEFLPTPNVPAMQPPFELPDGSTVDLPPITVTPRQNTWEDLMRAFDPSLASPGDVAGVADMLQSGINAGREAVMIPPEKPTAPTGPLNYTPANPLLEAAEKRIASSLSTQGAPVNIDMETGMDMSVLGAPTPLGMFAPDFDEVAANTRRLEAVEDKAAGWLFDNPEVADVLIDLGSSMMAGESPYALQNVGNAAMYTTNAYDKRAAARRESELANRKAEREDAALALDAIRAEQTGRYYDVLAEGQRAASTPKLARTEINASGQLIGIMDDGSPVRIPGNYSNQIIQQAAKQYATLQAQILSDPMLDPSTLPSFEEFLTNYINGIGLFGGAYEHVE